MSYYVYELVDPRDGKPFYIGKGKGERMHQHEREAARGVYSRKCERIREIVAAGMKVEKSVLARYAIETDAYDAERLLIEQIGLENLTNVVPGGVFMPRAPKIVVEEKFGGFRGLLKIAPTIARIIKLQAAGFLCMIQDWNLTDFNSNFLCDLVDHFGEKEVSKVLSNYGVTVSLDGGG